MLQSSPQPDEEFFESLGDNVKMDAAGNVFIHLKNQEVIGLSPLSLSELLKVPILEAKEVMKEAVKVAVEIDIKSASEMSGILLNVMDIMDQEKADQEGRLPAFIENSLITIQDVGEILDISDLFAEKVFRAFKRPINSEEDLEVFTDFIATYIHENHMGHFPKEANRDHIITTFDSNIIDDILSQEAPKELRSEDEIRKEQYVREAKTTLKELLSVTAKDADMIIAKPALLKDFLALKSKKQAEKIIAEALEGNQAPLLEALQSQSGGILEQLSDHAIRDVLDPSVSMNIHPSTSPLPKNLDNPTGEFTLPPATKEEILSPDKSPQNVSEIIDDKKGMTPENVETIPEDDADDDDLPETLDETLTLCFEMRGRLTSKSLAEIFDIWGTEISMAMGRFIIEEGGYGSTGEDAKRITDKKQLDRLISDINKAGTLRVFIRKYLKMVNDQVQSMYYGGGVS